jgi:hypothetical protein
MIVVPMVWEKYGEVIRDGYFGKKFGDFTAAPNLGEVPMSPRPWLCYWIKELFAFLDCCSVLNAPVPAVTGTVASDQVCRGWGDKCVG